MNKLTILIKNHQIIAFFVITFIISWGLGYTCILVVNEGIFMLAPLTVIAMVGPALSPHRSHTSKSMIRSLHQRNCLKNYWNINSPRRKVSHLGR